MNQATSEQASVRQPAPGAKGRERSGRKRFNREGYLELYLILLPSLALLVLFKYIPMGGLIVAFQDYNIFQGIGHSPFVGLKHFHALFSSDEFYRVLRNTLVINIYKLAFWVPLPAFFAILLNEVRKLMFRKVLQTTLYLPHFLSWVIVGGVFVNLLQTHGGLVNDLIASLGGKRVSFLLEPAYFRHIIVASSMWKEVGWGTIVYLAAIAGINPQLYEAAAADGASKLRQIRHITIPGIGGTIVLMTMMSLGNLLGNSFEQILIMYNPAVYNVGDVLETYVFRNGIGQMQYSYTTAVGIFSGVVGFILVVTANKLCRKFFNQGMW
ncbi:ABC transporter permease [Cohnella zeiphila]|uniref:Sugar ABC transporter permease n=1 Tax=Cohnella zeiphila TaxID=2761120 RepID=A0A7X0SRG0_9BACL|nr:ABC transporter permease subunit [Cohnella zeiphila]MBB6734788.1 sugar ABC transporter permease [Cohnella zeiphila]